MRPMLKLVAIHVDDSSSINLFIILSYYLLPSIDQVNYYIVLYFQERRRMAVGNKYMAEDGTFNTNGA